MSNATATKPTDIATEIENTDAAAVLLDDGSPYRSFCGGSDTLERLGLMDHDGQVSDVGRDVRDILRSWRRSA